MIYLNFSPQRGEENQLPKILFYFRKCRGKNKNSGAPHAALELPPGRAEHGPVRRFNSYYKNYFSISEKIITDYKKFGECSLKDESESKSKYVVISIDETHSPKLLLHNIQTSKSGEVKVSKKLFSQKNIKEEDILILLDYEQKNKGYYEDGKWVKVPDKFDIWLQDYIICK